MKYHLSIFHQLKVFITIKSNKFEEKFKEKFEDKFEDNSEKL